MRIELSLAGLSIDGVTFDRGLPLESYSLVIGPPSRTISPGPPAPCGHRNNQIHFYDEIGIYLNEHHATFLIKEVNVLLAPEHTRFPTKEPFLGDVVVCNLVIRRGMNENEFLQLSAKSSVQFRHHLGHSWYIENSLYAIDIDTFAALSPSGRKSRRRYLSSAAFGFRGAHKVGNQRAGNGENR